MKISTILSSINRAVLTLWGILYHAGVILFIISAILMVAFVNFHHELNCSKGAVVTTLQFWDIIVTLPCDGTTTHVAMERMSQ